MLLAAAVVILQHLHKPITTERSIIPSSAMQSITTDSRTFCDDAGGGDAEGAGRPTLLLCHTPPPRGCGATTAGSSTGIQIQTLDAEGADYNPSVGVGSGSIGDKVAGVSFTMDPADRLAGKTGCTAYLQFTPSAGGALAGSQIFHFGDEFLSKFDIHQAHQHRLAVGVPSAVQCTQLFLIFHWCSATRVQFFLDV
jgi:hypothetical protein